ncbi:MAG: HAD-IC family P-type ATPase, partial [Synergistota bacterium]|nr:HAD-IC family P-type ATPase [Synergistota bacterium]
MSKKHDAMQHGIPEFPHAHSVQGLADWMDVREAEGLANEEADERRARFGPNALDQAPPEPWWRTLLKQFLTPMIYLLAAASLISFFMGEPLDGMAILIVVLVNGVIGFITEFRAEKALQALKSMISLQATVRRNGKILKMNSEDIVPGDVVLLEAGDVVPADARIIESRNLALDEAALTGESMPVNKTRETLPESTSIADRINCVFSGTSVVRGNGEVLVFATGMDSQIGLISGMLATVEKQRTPLEERLERLSGFLIRLVVGVAVFVVGLGFLQGRGFVHMLETGIALAVAAVPEGLPFVATMTLALGVHRMAGVNALVRNLSSVETLGSTTVVCTDKTGTLTLNDMAVRELWPVDGDTVEDIYRVSVLCNKAVLGENGKNVGDPMEVALLAYCRDEGVDIDMIRRTFPVT